MKILVLDIETTPHVTFTWGLWKANIGHDMIIHPSQVLCWSAKWVGQRKIYFAGQNTHTMEAMMEELHDLLTEADAVVHYNGTKFDIPRINTEFARLHWEQPDPFKQVDMLRVVRKHFKFASNKLDYVCKELGIPGKLSGTRFHLWIDCMDGKASAWKIMKKYNINDIKILEELYHELKGWIHNHPNIGLYASVDDSFGARPRCTNCGSDRVVKKGIETTAARVYRRYRCNDCQHPMRGASSLVRDESGEWVERKTDKGELR